MKKNLSTLVALLLTLAHVTAAPAARKPRPQTPPPAPQQHATMPARQQQTPPPARQQQPAPQQTPQPSTSPSPQATTPAQPTPAAEPDEDVVRITSNLVQFDAVVTDKGGRLVTDLRPEDFEVLVDGRPQEVTNFAFVSSEPAAAPVRAAERPAGADAPPPPPAPVRPSQVRRTIALVVDDLGTSFEDIVFVRRALKRFVDEQMQPGDLVAIMRTSAGVGALQQFTTDKRILHRAIERVRWNPMGRAGVSAFAPIERNPAEDSGAGGGGGDNRGEHDRDGTAALEEFREGVFTVGTLGALNFIIRGMRELPGRKSILVFSDGFAIYKKPGNNDDPRNTDRIIENLRRLTDAANRASVVIYTMDARGLPTLGLTAADSVTPGNMMQAMESRRDEYYNNQEGLAYLARQTGGLFIRNTNDLGGGVRRVLDDQRGYYLIGFRPAVDVFEPLKGRTRFNKFEVKVRRAGLEVRTRAGFYGYAENAQRAAAPRTRSQQLVAALASPLTSGELTLRLTSLFNSPASRAEVVDSLLHIDVSQFKLTDEPDGWKRAVIDVVAITFGEDGQVVDEINRTETVRMRDDSLRHALSEGLVYLMKVPVKKPGAYQLRVAVRDAATERVGSASQFIEVPDLKKNRLALSGIFMIAAPAAGAAPAAESGPPDPVRDAAVRRFRQGSAVDFIYHIYNARAERAGGRPQLQTQTRIFRDGQPVFSGSVQPYDPQGEADMTRLRAGSRIQLGGAFPPGEYVLQVVVTDTLARGKNRNATQWIDFEVVK